MIIKDVFEGCSPPKAHPVQICYGNFSDNARLGFFVGKFINVYMIGKIHHVKTSSSSKFICLHQCPRSKDKTHDQCVSCTSANVQYVRSRQVHCSQPARRCSATSATRSAPCCPHSIHTAFGSPVHRCWACFEDGVV